MNETEPRIDVLTGDPYTGRLEPMRFPQDSDSFLESCRSFLGCRHLETIRLSGLHRETDGIVAWVDEEGLLKLQGGLWRIAGRSTGYAGRLVLSGETASGDPAALPANAGGLHQAIEMLGARVSLDRDDPDTARDGAVRLKLVRTA